MATHPETILITGASSGLGLGFVQHYAQLDPPRTILALDKQPLPASALPPDSPATLHFHQTDITDPPSLEALAATYTATRLSLVIHCAGIRGLVPAIVAQQQQQHGAAADVAAAETLSAMDRETMMNTFRVNTWGTFNLIRSFLPLLLAYSSSYSAAAQQERGARPVVVVLSSRMSSVSANVAGGGYAYRASKAALNAVVKSFVMDVPQVRFLLLHPGRVETGLVAWKEEGAVGVEESVRDCVRVLERMVEEGWESGRLVDRFGEVIAW